MRMDFYHFLFVLCYFGDLLLVHCIVSVHSPWLWTNFEGVGFLSKLVYGQSINTYHWILMKDFYFQVEGPCNGILIYLPILSFLLLHSPHTLMLMVHLLEWCLHFAEDIWCQILGIWCMAMQYSVHILCKSKYQKSMYERLAFPCSRILPNL